MLLHMCINIEFFYSYRRMLAVRFKVISIIVVVVVVVVVAAAAAAAAAAAFIDGTLQNSRRSAAL